MTGAVLGAIAGSLIASQHTDRSSSRIASGVGGAAIGGMIGDSVAGGSSSNFVNGVQLVYRTSGGKVLQSAQVGRLCEFRTGKALMVSSERGETRIQPNNPYGCAQRK
ncbi:outer membrane lipoprotein [gut metagenome]|uniref:Outer membrane lipoprotein n=1 Tax=gut metagenome TaxID=749906 RepID=J9FXN0_9ZZZZ